MEYTQELKEKMAIIEANFNAALKDFARQAGYIEGTLDTMITVNMEMNPEISMTADRLVKSFRSIEGICARGLKQEFASLLSLYEDIMKMKIKTEKEQNEKTQSPIPDLDSAIKALKGKNSNGK